MTSSSNDSLTKMRTQVLVVGAGPIGLLAALRLRKLGVQVRLVDQQSEHRAHTFPVVLHLQSLRLLDELGLAAALFWRGRVVKRLAIYNESEPRAVLDLPGAAGGAAGILTIPQDILRQALTTELARQGVEIEWNTRLAMMQQDAHAVWGRLLHEDPARRLRSAAHPEVASFDAAFVIGADGYESTVREALGIRLLDQGPLQSFAFFDATTQRSGNEAQLALSAEHMNTVYPLQGGQSRFSFQLYRGLHTLPDESALHELLRARMPWYIDEIASCDWSGVAEFRHALVERFGAGRVWLAGEAAHLTGPLGVQSLNVGLGEANDLAQHIAGALRDHQQPSFGQHYEARRQRQWRELLNLEPGTAFTARSPQWARGQAGRLVTCLPASGHDLYELLTQLRLAPLPGPADNSVAG